jgi:hypothetical protein
MYIRYLMTFTDRDIDILFVIGTGLVVFDIDRVMD